LGGKRRLAERQETGEEKAFPRDARRMHFIGASTERGEGRIPVVPRIARSCATQLSLERGGDLRNSPLNRKKPTIWRAGTAARRMVLKSADAFGLASDKRRTQRLDQC
jgi:hypothetical protein